MRDLLAILVLAAAVTALAATSSSAAAGCAPAGARILAGDHQARVYASRGVVYGCDTRTHTTTKLGKAKACIAAARVDHVALAWDVAGYGLDRCGVDSGFATVVVRRLSDGKRLKRYAAITGPGLVESEQSIGSIVVKRDGSVAWIGVQKSIIGQGVRIEVHGNRRLLDSSVAIKPGSLTLTGSTLSWRDGDLTRSATLR